MPCILRLSSSLSFTFLFLLSFAIGGTAATSPAHAAELKGVTFPEQETVAGKSLVLNGVGVRQVSMFKIDIYVAGLYVGKKSDSADEILHSPGPKKIQMVFVHDAPVGRIRDAWTDSFNENCKPNCEALKPGITKVNALMTELKKGDRMSFVFDGSKVLVECGGNKGEVDLKTFPDVLLATWIGPKPPTEDLKLGLLGKKN